MPITHPFVSGKSDGGDATLVKPSDWNAGHVVSIETPDEAPLAVPAVLIAATLNGAF